MIARLLISQNPILIKEEVSKFLISFDLSNPHPDLLYFQYNSKLGIPEARKIKEHFSLKPYSAKGKVVVLEDASTLTNDAQNALLKTLEELPKESMLILAAKSEDKLLPTIISRCQIVRINSSELITNRSEYEKDIEELLNASISERFEYIEKLKDKEELLHSLVDYFHQNLRLHPKGVKLNFVKELLQAETWANQNVNIRAILEYLMLVMPKEV